MAIDASTMKSMVGEPQDQQQCLMFNLNSETFALPILCIREILEYEDPTEVPMMPAFVRGIVNLRGAVVPVIDLAVRFGRDASPGTARTCIVIVEARTHDETHVFGVIVDAVNEVLEIRVSDTEAPPPFGATIRADFIRSMGKVRGRFINILDIDAALSCDDMVSLARAMRRQ